MKKFGYTLGFIDSSSSEESVNNIELKVSDISENRLFYLRGEIRAQESDEQQTKDKTDDND